MNRTKKKHPIKINKSTNSQNRNNRTETDRPTISLCMIVKNEEKYLAGCLESVRDLVDEMIIVDTGSTDSTIQIAESFGAHIYHFDWINDFAAARNESLAHANGDWILYLDADERLEPVYHTKIRKAVQNNYNAGAFYLRITSQQGMGESSRVVTHTYPRLFKNLPGVQFEGSVHEQIIPSLNTLGASGAHCDAVITHLGYAIAAEDEHRKYQRNLELLLSQLDENPDNFFFHFNLGRTYLGLNQHENGLQELEYALTLPDSTNCPHLTANAHFVVGIILFKIKHDPDGAISAARSALTYDPRLLPAQTLIAEAYLAKGQFEEATSCFEQAVKISQTERRNHDLCDEAVPDIDNLYESLGVTQVKAGHCTEAIRSLRKALALNPQKTECHLHLGEALMQQSQYKDALISFKRYLEDDKAQQRLKAFYGCTVACLQLGDSEQAESYLRNSQEQAPDLLSATEDLVDLLSKENRQVKALNYLQSLPNNLATSAKALKLQCRLLEELEQWQELMNTCDQLKQAEIESALLMTYTGKAFEHLEQGEKALRCYERAVNLDAEYAQAWEAIGTYCLNTGNYPMGLECLQMALNLGLQSADIFKSLGLASSAVGDQLGAQRYFKQALAMNPNDEFASNQLRSLAMSA